VTRMTSLERKKRAEDTSRHLWLGQRAPSFPQRSCNAEVICRIHVLHNLQVHTLSGVQVGAAKMLRYSGHQLFEAGSAVRTNRGQR